MHILYNEAAEKLVLICILKNDVVLFAFLRQEVTEVYF